MPEGNGTMTAQVTKRWEFWAHLLQTGLLLAGGLWVASQLVWDVRENKKDIVTLTKIVDRKADIKDLESIERRIGHLARQQDVETIKDDVQEIRRMVFQLTRQAAGVSSRDPDIIERPN